MNKANYGAQARATGAQTRDVSAQANALATVDTGVPIGQYTPLGRELPYNVPFGPLTPLPPYGIDPIRPDGRSDPRAWEYPVGWNIPGGEQRLVPFDTLRAAARTDIVQDCMRVIRTEITGLDWAITVSEKAIAAAAEEDGLRKTEAKQKLREKLAPQIARAMNFWQAPDPKNCPDFPTWLWMGLEEVLTLDAWPLYPQLTYGNDLCALWNVAGDVIKPLLDHRGRRPEPPDPAFQEIMYGFPRGEFTSPIGKDGTIDKGRTADEMIYSVRNVRVSSPYGFGPVENALVRINLWMKRADWMTKQFDANSLPLAMMELPEKATLEPHELRRWRRAINDQLSGDLAERQRIQLGFPGGKLAKFADNAELYKPEYDTYIVKLICASFQVTPAEIGFIETGGLGGSSYHEGQENIQYRKMILPWAKWLSGIFNMINRRYLGLDPAIEFRFLGLEEEDEAAADAVLLSRVESGRMTLNEARDQQGMAPYSDMPEADEPYILSRMGPQFIRGLQEQQEAQGEAVKAGAEQAKQNLEAGKLPSGKDPNTPKAEREDGDEQTPDDGKTPTAGEDGNVKPPAKKPAASKAAVAELDSFANWARKLAAGKAKARPFTFTTVDDDTARQLNHLVLDDSPADAASLAKATAAELRKAGGGGGRVDSPRPGSGAGGMARVPGTRPVGSEDGGAGLPGRVFSYR
ncbi:phage portal protein [Frankia sp. AgW1.1]|nr:phage portal protein [Frankia sp. AgW1.1]